MGGSGRCGDAQDDDVGRSCAQILQSGCSYWHSRYLIHGGHKNVWGHKDIQGGGCGSTRPGGLGGKDNKGRSGYTASGGGEVERHKLASAVALKHNNQLKCKQ